MGEPGGQQGFRVAVIGAGPIGLEAAACAVAAGLDVAVYERGRVASAVRDWGHVRLFTPFAMNSSAWGRAAVAAAFGAVSLPANDEQLTGRGLVSGYLEPLSRIPALAGRIHESFRVRAITRQRTWKHHLVGRRETVADRFRILLDTPVGERVESADVVLDCSGTWPNHNWIGAGGVPCPGERRLLAAGDYRLPDVAGIGRDRFAGRTTLVVGSGYSAATTVAGLVRLARDAPGTRVVWVTRDRSDGPLTAIDDDPLTERLQLAQQANRSARDGHGPVDWRPGRLVQAIRPAGNRFAVRLDDAAWAGQGEPGETIEVDRIVANVGYRPDRSLYEELQVHECYATGGPIALAAKLLGEQSADCLDQSAGDARLLENPEPGFFILGAKSYGRDSRFLLSVGHQQIRLVLDRFTARVPGREVPV